MKKIITSIVLVLLFSGALLAQPAAPTQPASDENAGDLKFAEETWDFGNNIPQNTSGEKPVTHDFRFTNTGKEPVVISDCHASCGCTIPKWPHEPILPGKTDVIQVTYNARNAGGFDKTITITSNAKTPSKLISIKGTVITAPVEQTTPEKPTGIVTPK